MIHGDLKNQHIDQSPPLKPECQASLSELKDKAHYFTHGPAGHEPILLSRQFVCLGCGDRIGISAFDGRILWVHSKDGSHWIAEHNPGAEAALNDLW